MLMKFRGPVKTGSKPDQSCKNNKKGRGGKEKGGKKGKKEH